MFRCQSEDRFIFMKTKYPVHIMVYGLVTSDGDAMPQFILPHGHQTQHRGLHQAPAEGSDDLDRVTAERAYVRQQECTMPHKQKKPVLAVRIFL